MPRMRLNTDGTLTPIGQARPRTARRGNPDTAERRHRNTREHRAWAKAVIARDGCCQQCGATTDLTADHITPLTHGGTTTLDNGQALCRTCNGRKGGTERRHTGSQGGRA